MWFNHFGRALKMAGVPQPHESSEFASLDEEEWGAFFKALVDMVLPGSLVTRARQPEWEEAFGFNSLEANLVVSMGEFSSQPLQPIYLEGAFDQDVIRHRLAGLGYQEQDYFGQTYYAIHRDYEILFGAPAATVQPGTAITDSRDTVSHLALSEMNRVFVGDGSLIAAPATEMVTSILETWSGISTSLAADPAYASLARALGDPLSAGILNRQQVLQSESARPVKYDKPVDWGTLHQWDTFGVGYGQADDESGWVAFSIFYSDPDAAEADSEELIHRMNGYKTAVPEMWPDASEELLDQWPKEPVSDICEVLTATAHRQGNGSTLTIRCPLAHNAKFSWWMLVDLRDLGFLIP